MTNPDKPSGRKLEPHAPPVKLAALEAGLDVLQPERPRADDFVARIAELDPDVATVVAYGKLLPRELLEVPRLGFVNVHFSLLPLYRGAAPVQRCLIDGCTRTGAAIMLLTEGMDEGPVLAVQEVEVSPDEDAGALGARLAKIGAPLLVDSLHGYAEGTLQPREQDHSSATYAPKITNEETQIDWTQSAIAIRNLIRGLSPTPGAWTTLKGARLKVFRAEPAHLVTRAGEGPAPLVLEPGEIRTTLGLHVGTGSGALDLTDVQLAGKRRMSGAELVRGLRITPGETFERHD